MFQTRVLTKSKSPQSKFPWWSVPEPLWRLPRMGICLQFMQFWHLKLFKNQPSYQQNMRSIETCLRRRTLIHFLSIDLMIMASNSKKVRNLLLVQSTASPRTSLSHYEITLMKILQRTSFDIPSHLLELLSYLSRRKTAPFICAWTIVD